jgi:hypothetical protein
MVEQLPRITDHLPPSPRPESPPLPSVNKPLPQRPPNVNKPLPQRPPPKGILKPWVPSPRRGAPVPPHEMPPRPANPEPPEHMPPFPPSRRGPATPPRGARAETERAICATLADPWRQRPRYLASPAAKPRKAKDYSDGPMKRELRRTAWWSWQDSNRQPSDYSW